MGPFFHFRGTEEIRRTGGVARSRLRLARLQSAGGASLRPSATARASTEGGFASGLAGNWRLQTIAPLERVRNWDTPVAARWRNEERESRNSGAAFYAATAIGKMAAARLRRPPTMNCADAPPIPSLPMRPH